MDKKVVYTPKSQLMSPRKLGKEMLQDLRASRELAWRLAIRDISARYRQSLLGLMWAFLPPIMTGVIFIALNSGGVVNFEQTSFPYPAYVMVGTVLWQLFVDGINSPLRVVNGSKSMLSKINFPREALILSAIYQTLFDFAVRVPIIAAVFLLFRIEPTFFLILAIPAALSILLFGVMIGLAFTPAGILYNDVQAILSTLINLWFFATPVVYEIPQKGPFSLIVALNPMTPLLRGVREMTLSGTMTDVLGFAVITSFAFGGLMVMWVLYRISIPVLAERMSA